MGHIATPAAFSQGTPLTSPPLRQTASFPCCALALLALPWISLAPPGRHCEGRVLGVLGNCSRLLLLLLPQRASRWALRLRRASLISPLLRHFRSRGRASQCTLSWRSCRVRCFTNISTPASCMRALCKIRLPRVDLRGVAIPSLNQTRQRRSSPSVEHGPEHSSTLRSFFGLQQCPLTLCIAHCRCGRQTRCDAGGGQLGAAHR